MTDPDATLAKIVNACVNGDRRELYFATQDMRAWLAKGGYRPSIDALLANISNGIIVDITWSPRTV
jgi:hypothetical protein